MLDSWIFLMDSEQRPWQSHGALKSYRDHCNSKLSKIHPNPSWFKKTRDVGAGPSGSLSLVTRTSPACVPRFVSTAGLPVTTASRNHIWPILRGGDLMGPMSRVQSVHECYATKPYATCNHSRSIVISHCALEAKHSKKATTGGIHGHTALSLHLTQHSAPRTSPSLWQAWLLAVSQRRPLQMTLTAFVARAFESTKNGMTTMRSCATHLPVM